MSPGVKNHCQTVTLTYWRVVVEPLDTSGGPYRYLNGCQLHLNMEMNEQSGMERNRKIAGSKG